MGTAMADGSGMQQKKVSPPYIAFQSLKTMAASFKEHDAVPDRIDRSVLTNFSGAVGAQIITALRFLGLIDSNGQPTPLMREFVESFNTPAWQATLAKVLKEAYAPIFALNLVTSTPAQFLERFRTTYDGAEDVTRKSITFFLNAVREAEIPISKFIMKARKPRTAPTKKRTPRPAASDVNTAELEEDDVDPPASSDPPTTIDPAQMLLEVLDTEVMDDKEQEAVWTLLKFLKKSK
jgi:hypothetical protein